MHRIVVSLHSLINSWIINKEIWQIKISKTLPYKVLSTTIKSIINTARTNAVRSVDFCRVLMYRAIGHRIVEKEQQGKGSAEYGKYLIKSLAKEIEPEYGSGFGERQLNFCRQFYNTYSILNACVNNWIGHNTECSYNVAKKPPSCQVCFWC